jgi:para-nitrobenzyl esterase
MKAWRPRPLVLVVIAASMTPSTADPVAPADATPALVVPTESGAVRGVSEAGVRAYRGIPYAAPPVGALRWRPPQPLAPWEGVRAAAAFGQPCPQPGLPEPMSEDCLTLNVWSPAGPTPAGGWPVMVWIHGGGFRSGAGSDPDTGGDQFAREGVVLVSLDYRLGALGFFAHSALAAESPGEPGVDYGILDMVAALDWVKRNIAAFGGDPSRVTIFGESAGGMAIHLLMVAPQSAGLFGRAIAMSGYGTWPLPRARSAPPGNAPRGGGSAEDLAAAIVRRATPDLGAPVSPDALRRIPAARLVDGVVGGLYLPIVDGHVIPEEPGIVFARGRQHDVPFVAGADSFDGAVMPWAGVKAEDVLATWSEHRVRIRELYGEDFAVSEERGASRLFGESRYVMAGRTLARLMGGVRSPGYLYLFAFVRPAQRGELPGAPHGSEVPLLFGHDDDAEATEVGRTMRAYFVDFARTGDPNGPGRPGWPVYDGASDRWLVFDRTTEVRARVFAERLDFLEARYDERVAPALAEPVAGTR